MQDPVQFGDYKLVRRLAVSSMSEVYLAYPLTGKRTSTPGVDKAIS